ncbi:hypothetical protein REK76_13740 [Nocardia farcinica]|uniref:hypothetical protein n=1 Tax=Nocardia farcinica TaxID=37329 RepID=UPI00311DF66E
MDSGRVETELDRQIAAVRGEAIAGDRSVAIETDAVGRITRLYVADYAMDDGPERLAAILLEQHRIAHGGAVAQAIAVLESQASEVPGQR